MAPSKEEITLVTTKPIAYKTFLCLTSWFALAGMCSCRSQQGIDDDLGEGDAGSSNESGNKSDSDTGETGDDADYYQIRIKPEYDMGGDYGDQGTLYTYSIATCELDRFSLRRDAYPYIWIMVFFHDDYDLVGTHLPRVEEEGGYQHGFLARYNSDAYDDEAGPWDQYLVAESGTVEISDEEDELYKVVWDLVFSDEIHEVGEMVVEPCDSPFYDDGASP